MTGKEAFKIWAPSGKKWTDWVRPVPFVGIREHSKGYQMSELAVPAIDLRGQICVNVSNKDSNTGGISYEIYKNAALIVDLPGAESVEEGLALAKAGYRPIPVYNGTVEQSGARATVDNQTVGAALLWGAQQISQMKIDDDALPVFLLDSNRMNRFKMETALFDNSWDIYHQDLPSADYFLQNGIDKIIVIGQRFSKDLKKIFYGFQKKNIQIYFAKPYETPKKVRINIIEVQCFDKI